MSRDAPPTGFIKLARKAFSVEHGDPFWLEDREFSRWEAWVDVIQLAAWKDGPYQTRYFGTVELKRGQFVASLRWLSDRWKWTIKRVRTWLSTCENDGRLRAHPRAQVRAHPRAQDGAQAGTVYLIVKYDTYQSVGHSEGTPKGIAGAHPRTAKGHKIEAVKAVSTTTSALDALPKNTLDAAYDRWIAALGAVNYGFLRKALLPVFRASPRVYSGEQLADAVDAFSDAAKADDPKYRGKWNAAKFGAEIHEWVRLGTMELVDEWGQPTERGRASGIFAETR